MVFELWKSTVEKAGPPVYQRDGYNSRRHKTRVQLCYRLAKGESMCKKGRARDEDPMGWKLAY